MSFGYSVGDVIAGANLTYRLLRAMADTKGASTEYLEAMTELSGIQQAFLQVSQIRSHEMLPPATINAASHIIMSSIDTIADFLEKTKQYRRRLSDPKSKGFQNSWYKVGWTLYKSHELKALRDSLHTRLTSIQTLLAAAQYCVPLPSDMKQYQVDNQDSDKTASAIVAPQTTERASGAAERPNNSSSELPTPLESESEEMMKKKSQYMRRSEIAEEQKAVYGPSETSRDSTDQLQDPSDRSTALLSFKDAVGRRFKLPFHMCSTWQGMEEIIKQAFLHVDVLGPHVMEGHYDLISSDGEIILPSVWEKVITPEDSISMTMWPIEKGPSNAGPVARNLRGRNPPPPLFKNWPGRGPPPGVQAAPRARPGIDSRPLAAFLGRGSNRRLNQHTRPETAWPESTEDESPRVKVNGSFSSGSSSTSGSESEGTKLSDSGLASCIGSRWRNTIRRNSRFTNGSGPSGSSMASSSEGEETRASDVGSITSRSTRRSLKRNKGSRTGRRSSVFDEVSAPKICATSDNSGDESEYFSS